MKTSFEDWFYELEGIQTRSQRFFNECDVYLKNDSDLKSEGEKIFLDWLKVAFETGKGSV
jgi:hypothetical protein